MAGGGFIPPQWEVGWNIRGQVTVHRENACLRLRVIGNQLSGKISAHAQPDMRSRGKMPPCSSDNVRDTATGRFV